jgi:hypothetical protein
MKNACGANPLPCYYKQVVTKKGIKYRQRAVKPETKNTAELLRNGTDYVSLPSRPHLRKLDKRKKSVKVILKYHDGDAKMCRKWYLKRLSSPASEGVPAIPGYMQSLSNNSTYADVYIADGYADYCMYSHIINLIRFALEQQSTVEDHEEDEESEGTNYEPEV